MSVMVWTTLLLLLLWAVPMFQSRRTKVTLAYKGIGEQCEQNSECRSDCCVTNSLDPQKFCTPHTMFLQCVPWKKPNGHPCEEHSECQNNCCVRTSYSSDRFCSAKSIFLQCVSWRKPEGDLCQTHSECWSLCCLPLRETSPSHCTKRTGLLALCLPVVVVTGCVVSSLQQPSLDPESQRDAQQQEVSRIMPIQDHRPQSQGQIQPHVLTCSYEPRDREREVEGQAPCGKRQTLELRAAMASVVRLHGSPGDEFHADREGVLQKCQESTAPRETKGESPPGKRKVLHYAGCSVVQAALLPDPGNCAQVPGI
ncbi:leucine-rich colipase-like protein 1 [Psammomys obesus]|uniref:leucine-rich colipase-like protein 1 n=1 Tax=Psammomys obesus TaxID=48139 RepID=UPI002452F807|nr:leucine-rich colipase-like protein 1 [Psammomys obesus]